jgi:hypothetical protein
MKPAENASPLQSGGREQEPISVRLAELLSEMLAGNAPNAGRFCGNCYNPLATDRMECRFCGLSVAEQPTVDSVPPEVLEAHRLRLGREGLVVRSVAWGGLTLGVILALVPLAFAGVHLWTLAAFFGVLVLFYLLSANLANTIGDSLGYAWGLRTFRSRWERFLKARDG